jgi:aspartate aminotransferase
MISEIAKSVLPSATMALNTKSKEMIAGGADVISFGIGQPHLDTPEHIKHAAKQAIEDGRTGYTPAIGEVELRKAIQAKCKRDAGIDYELSEIAVGNGGKGILYELLLTILDPGDEVIIPLPYWVSYTEMLTMVGAKPVFVSSDPLTFEINLDELESKMSPKTKLIMLNSPNNPSGAMYQRATLEGVLEIAKKHDTLILSDEVYEKLVFDEPFLSITELSDDAVNRTIVLNSVSKAYAMTGWRIGYVATKHREIISAIANLQGNNQGNPSSIAQYAAIEAYNGPQDSVISQLPIYKAGRDIVMEYLNQIPELSAVPPKGAFYAFPKLEIPNADSFKIAEKLLQEAHVAVVPGKPFGLEGYLRLSFAMGEERLREGMERILTWFKEEKYV